MPTTPAPTPSRPCGSATSGASRRTSASSSRSAGAGPPAPPSSPPPPRPPPPPGGASPAPPAPPLAPCGERAYRLATLAAGVAGGRAYLAAYALGFGASGLTFYDREVTDFFAPHAAGRGPRFVTALGRSARAARATIEADGTP